MGASGSVCLFFAAELVLTPGFGNQLGGTPVLVRGRCREGGDITCLFAGSANLGRYVDDNTVLCTTPVINSVGSVGLDLRRVDSEARIIAIIASTTFTNGKDCFLKFAIIMLFSQFPLTERIKLIFQLYLHQMIYNFTSNLVMKSS